ncbi:putative aldouronate transport system permease protein [Paenibacillus sp. yr247]|uniref:carbohydrate ABC transporter permease n=1 Tax=Paenibacillus sp. yr247 TaxID=1761880 RepID=UPI00088533CC|nr:carbohydrate ABC transporter permease [Paenibacillus sp. yr247]SDO24197.1 putative aldouronate transport system permease protein [Paenibacillus sp. yr247]
MLHKISVSRGIFNVFNYSFLITMSILCILPLVHVFSISLSSAAAASAGFVTLWPIDFTFASYNYVLEKQEFARSFVVTLQRVGLGVVVNMFLTILVAYPLAKQTANFRRRTIYAWIFVVTILFHGGLIPNYLVVRGTGLLDTIWALILPNAVPVFNVIILLNFFRNLPKELEDASFVDGAGHWTILWKIFVPLSKPALATLTLFCIVNHWNEWFHGLIFMNSPRNYPLQSYLRTVVIEPNFELMGEADLSKLQEMSDRTYKAAQIFLGALPVLMVYPFLQRYFVKGIVLGSVKE